MTDKLGKIVDELDNSDDELEYLDEDLMYQKATLPDRFIQLQEKTCEFVTAVTLEHEKKFFNLVTNHFPDRLELLNQTNPTIIEMIVAAIKKFYCSIYYDIQNNTRSVNLDSLSDIGCFADYPLHILLDKLFRLTLDMHLDIIRENLSVDNIEIFTDTLLDEINRYFKDKNIFHIMAKGENDDEPFVPVPDGSNPFDIVIEKNIKNQ